MKKCSKCKNEIDPSEIYGNWFYCEICKETFDYPPKENVNSKETLKNNPQKVEYACMTIKTTFEYTIRHTNYGILIFGAVPLQDAISICRVFGSTYDYDLCDAVISQHYEAVMCITTKEKSALWRKEIKK